MPFIRSISGLRATLGDCLLPEVISRYSAAFAKVCPEGNIVIGRDGRPSGEWIEKLITGTLNAAGRNVIILGVVPTPTVQLVVEDSKAAGGIAITASHNPAQWNGMKFINKSGVFLNKSENEELWNAVDNNLIEFSEKSFSKIEYDYQAIDNQINKILGLSYFKATNEFKIKAVVDAVNASGSVAILSLLAKMGLEGIPLYCDGTGLFPHTPEPLSQNLTDLSQAVTNYQADIGIAVDPDADRLVLIDENGNPIGEEKTIALSVYAVLENLYSQNPDQKQTVVVNYSTTRLVEDVAAMFNAEVHRSAVGEINVVTRMKELGSVIGGEGSGGVILPECHYGRDSLVGTALILSLLRTKMLKLSEMVAILPSYEMLKYKQEFSGSLDEIIVNIKNDFSEYKITEDDGIRIDLPKSWVQLRSSNTEPILRIISEAETLTEAQNLVDRVLALLD